MKVGIVAAIGLSAVAIAGCGSTKTVTAPAGGYPASFGEAFQASCENNGGTAAKCECALSYVQSHDTYASVQKMTLAQIGTLDEKAIANCAGQ
jgi:hypothetical protein